MAKVSDEDIQSAKQKEDLLKQTLRASNQLYQLFQEHPEIELSVGLTEDLIDDSGVVAKVLGFLRKFSFSFQVAPLNTRKVLAEMIVVLKMQTAIAIANRHKLEKAR